jgi:beta-N-acetylhexosaminidase
MLAGNDLVLICHQTDTAETAAAALSTLPHHVFDDVGRRLERFRRKALQPPLPWSSGRWETEISALKALAQDDPDGRDHSSSPVEQY